MLVSVTFISMFLVILMIRGQQNQNVNKWADSTSSLSHLLQVKNPKNSNYEEGSFSLEKINSDPQQFLALVEEFIGVNSFNQGAYRWSELNETLITTSEVWKKRPYFCPYTPFRGKWILTCKSQLRAVSLNHFYCVIN